jgi:hypothetical protein
LNYGTISKGVDALSQSCLFEKLSVKKKTQTCPFILLSPLPGPIRCEGIYISDTKTITYIIDVMPCLIVGKKIEGHTKLINVFTKDDIYMYVKLEG